MLFVIGYVLKKDLHCSEKFNKLPNIAPQMMYMYRVGWIFMT